MRVPRPGPSSTSLILLGLPNCCHTVRHQIPIICIQDTVWVSMYVVLDKQIHANTELLEGCQLAWHSLALNMDTRIGSQEWH